MPALIISNSNPSQIIAEALLLPFIIRSSMPFSFKILAMFLKLANCDLKYPSSFPSSSVAKCVATPSTTKLFNFFKFFTKDETSSDKMPNRDKPVSTLIWTKTFLPFLRQFWTAL